MGANLTCVTQQFFSVWIVSERDFTHHYFLNSFSVTKVGLSLARTLM